MDETNYVLVVHGTWNAPNDSGFRWHQLNEADPENFCHLHNNQLSDLGMGRPVWRKESGLNGFGWSGANRHQDRLLGGERLLKYIKAISRIDPTARIHIVAHSHGGNVVLHALERYGFDLLGT